MTTPRWRENSDLSIHGRSRPVTNANQPHSIDGVVSACKIAWMSQFCANPFLDAVDKRAGLHKRNTAVWWEFAAEIVARAAASGFRPRSPDPDALLLSRNSPPVVAAYHALLIGWWPDWRVRPVATVALRNPAWHDESGPFPQTHGGGAACGQVQWGDLRVAACIVLRVARLLRCWGVRPTAARLLPRRHQLQRPA